MTCCEMSAISHVLCRHDMNNVTGEDKLSCVMVLYKVLFSF